MQWGEYGAGRGRIQGENREARAEALGVGLGCWVLVKVDGVAIRGGMLRLLRVRNFALVEDLSWEVGEGFTVVTGETGAGKSILIGALLLLLGDRADRTMIRTGCDGCAVEAEWDLARAAVLERIRAVLDDSGAEPCEGAVLRLKRTLSSSGQNRHFVNGSTVPLATLKRLGDLLADFHGPHDHQSLLSVDTQRDLLDSFGGLTDDRARVGSLWSVWQEAERKHAELERETASTDREIERLRFESDEIHKAALNPGEDAEVSAQLDVVRNGQRLLELSQSLSALATEGEGSISDQLALALKQARELAAIDTRCSGWLELLGTAQASMGELSREAAHYADGLDLDGESLARIEDRFNAIQSLKRKYGPSLEEVIRRGDEARARLDRIERRDEALARAAEATKAAMQAFNAAAKSLSAARKKAAGNLAKAVTVLLKDLGFKKARFDAVVVATDVPASHGFDRVEFQFSPNVGEGAKPLRAIASSGEMARVMLAIKATLARQDEVPLLIFDEVDANVGGEIGAQVGRRLRELGTTHQVMCITHLPQVAALGHVHFQVRKREQGGRTITEVEALEGGERVEELARMLGGVTGSSRALAKAMLEEGARPEARG